MRFQIVLAALASAAAALPLADVVARGYQPPIPNLPWGGGCDIPKPTNFQDTVLYHHNCHRRNHTDTPDMTWSQPAADAAAQDAATCIYKHQGTGFGQNIGAGISAAEIGKLISDEFYNNESPRYTTYGAEPNMGGLGGFGHFTQVVWKQTTAVGCAVQDCTGRLRDGAGNPMGGISPFFAVCNYHTQGNMMGGFTVNIGTQLGKKALTGAGQ